MKRLRYISSKRAWHDDSWDENCTGARWKGKTISCDLPTPKWRSTVPTLKGTMMNHSKEIILHTSALRATSVYVLGWAPPAPTTCHRVTTTCAYRVLCTCLVPILLISKIYKNWFEDIINDTYLSYNIELSFFIAKKLSILI